MSNGRFYISSLAARKREIDSGNIDILTEKEYLEFLKGDFPTNKTIFDGIDTSWNRVEGGKAVGKLIQKVDDEFNFKNDKIQTNSKTAFSCQLGKQKHTYSTALWNS